VKELGDRLEVAVDECAVATDDDFDRFEAHGRERIRASTSSAATGMAGAAQGRAETVSV
jgi:hypothetical protein